MGKRTFALLAFATVAGGEAAEAHGLGQRYDLPVPLWLYLVGAAGAVVASFAFLLFFRKTPRTYPKAVYIRGTVPPVCVALLRILFVALFALLIVAGIAGNQKALKNIAPTLVWVIWWVGFTFLCAFFGNLWPIVSPFAAIFEWADRLCRQLWGCGIVLRWPYPAWLDAWPAFLLFLLFAWIELVAPGRDSPRAIAIGALIYAIITWTGCALFGPRVWLRRGEAFSVAFDLLGRFAPLQIVRAGRQWVWRVRPYAVGLLGKNPLAVSLTAFALLMLATVTVDGFLETPPWAAVMERFTPASASPLGATSPPLWPATLLLCLAPGLFAVSYLTVMQLMTALAPCPLPVLHLAGRFVLTLVPIAIAYHFAHYLSFLLLAGQLAIPLASDPFGVGWDLLGTSLYRIDIGIIDARTVWFLAVGAIVAGHILAVWLSHETALDIYREPGAARRSQVPMVALMTGYTIVSLWILAQPIVEQPR